MIPDKSDPRWKKLVTGEKNHQFKMTAAGMCVNRNQRMYKRDNSEAAMKSAVDNLHEFFTKFETIAVDDIKALFS